MIIMLLLLLLKVLRFIKHHVYQFHCKPWNWSLLFKAWNFTDKLVRALSPLKSDDIYGDGDDDDDDDYYYY